MPKEDNGITFEGRNPSTLFREFAAECMESAQKASSPEKRALYMKMASVWHQIAQRWEKKSQPSPWIEIDISKIGSRNALMGHSHDRTRDRVYHCLLFLGQHSGHWRRRLNRFLAKLLTKDEARRLAANIAKLPELARYSGLWPLL